MADHVCGEGRRFDMIEDSLKGIDETLKALGKIVVRQATDDMRIQHLETARNDHEDRLRALEPTALTGKIKMQWVERVVWLVVVGALTAYFKFGG